MNLNAIIRRATDMHFHIGPELIRRKYLVADLIKKELGKINSIVLKNHFYPTVPLLKSVKNNSRLNLIGSIVLNNFVGGINPEAVYAQTLITDKPFVVWFPTLHAENFLKQNTYEIPPEWMIGSLKEARKTSDIKHVKIVKGRALLPSVLEVLRLIKKNNLILATGHISWKESALLVKKAKQMKIRKIIITHPIYQSINMPVEVQKELAGDGCYVEQSYSMYSIDRIPISKIYEQITDLGYQSTILSSDMGQQFSSSSSKGLLKFCSLLSAEGIQEKDLQQMLVANPRKLLDTS